MAIFTDILSFLVPAYTSPSPFWIRGRRKEEKRYKGEPLQKLARFWREFDHFHGNFSMNLAFSIFPKFQVFFENSTKILNHLAWLKLLMMTRWRSKENCSVFWLEVSKLLKDIVEFLKNYGNFGNLGKTNLLSTYPLK